MSGSCNITTDPQNQTVPTVEPMFKFDFLFSDTASDIGGLYYTMTDSDLGGVESSLTTAGLLSSNDQELVNFVTLAGYPGVTSLESGIYSIHTHVEKTAGTRPTQIYCKLYKREFAGTETLLGTSEISGLITAKAPIDLDMNITADVTLLATDRLVIKFFANCGAGTDTTVVLYQEGNTNSRLSFNVSSSILSNVFIRKDIGTAQGDMIRWNAEGIPINLAKGTALQYLKMDATDTLPEWANLNIVEDTTPQLGASLDCQENDIDNLGDLIHDEAVASDFNIINQDEDKDIIFTANDGGVQTDIMILDGSEGQLDGVLIATAGVVGDITLPADASRYLDGTGAFSVPSGANDVWYDVNGTYASAATFTFAGDASDAAMIIGALFTCLSTGNARRVGYVKSASHAGGSVTVTVKCVEIGDLTTTGLEANDKDFKISYSHNIWQYRFHNYISNEVVADPLNPQGNRLYIREASYLIAIDVAAATPAAGAGASCAINVYENGTNLFIPEVDLTTNGALLDNIPNAKNELAADTWYTNRVMASAGTTNKAADLTIDSYIVPQEIYNGAA